MFKRIRQMWRLSNKDEEVLERLETLTPEEINAIPDKGNGKAVFLGEGTQEEFVEQERKDAGLAGWYKRIKNL